MSKVLFVEGCDGTGKSSVGKAIVDLYNQTGRKAVFLPIIEANPTGKDYRARYLGGELEGTPTLETLGMLYSVNLTLKTVVEPAMKENDLVVVDRSLASFYTYQIQTNKYTWMLEAFEEVLNSVVRGKTLYLTLDPQKALDRILAKRGFLDAVESRGADYQLRIACAYEDCFRQYAILRPSLVMNTGDIGTPDQIALQAVQQLYGDVTGMV